MKQLKKIYDEAVKADRKERSEMLASLAKRSRTHRLLKMLADVCHTQEGTIRGYIYGYREPSELVKETIDKNINRITKIINNGKE